MMIHNIVTYPALLLLHLGEAVAAPPPQEGEADPNRSAVAAAAPVVVAGGGDCWEGPRNADTPSNAGTMMGQATQVSSIRVFQGEFILYRRFHLHLME